MTEEQRTPGPWIIGEQSGAILAKNAPPYGNAKFIAETVNRKTALGRANAAFIVKACNAHDELVAACEALLHDYKGMVRENRRDGFIVEKVEAAIAKAKQ